MSKNFLTDVTVTRAEGRFLAWQSIIILARLNKFVYDCKGNNTYVIQEKTALLIVIALCKGPFKNYVDKILTIFDYLPTSTWTLFTLNLDKKKHF